MNGTCLRLARTSFRSAWNRRTAQVLVRHAHGRRALPYPIENGLGQFLSPQALKTIAVDYQEGLLERLNDEVRDTEDEGKDIVQTIVSTSWNHSKILAFNYASEALNNSFFLECLAPPEPDKQDHEKALKNGQLAYQIKMQYGDLQQFKLSVSAHVLGMFSSGWVWVVSDRSGALGIVPTFGPGTLIVRSRQQMGGPDDQRVVAMRVKRKTKPASNVSEPSGSTSNSANPNPSSQSHPATPTSPTSGLSNPPSPLIPPTQSRTFHTASRLSQLSATPSSIYGDDLQSSMDPRQLQDLDERLGEVLYPLFCVSVHERVWMSAGYGVWGQEEYMKRFWTVLDWKKVCTNYDKARPYSPSSFPNM